MTGDTFQKIWRLDVTSIGDGAFDECPNLTVHAPADSYAAFYATENGIPFVAE